MSGRRLEVAQAIAEAADDAYCFDDEDGDPEMFAARAEDRDYWLRIADAAIAVLDNGT